jgi:guanosine-3',5'-bis(diphosphate) 3'-pyrophosphohydrolase
MLDRAMDALGSSLEVLPPDQLTRYLDENKLRALEDLLADIALGNRTASQVARSLLQLHDEASAQLRAHAVEKIRITGAERGVLSFGNCCHPVPGDEIMGYLSAGKGIVVHRTECPNMAEFRKSPERCVEIAWDTSVSGDYRVELRIIVANKPGVLAQDAAAVAQSNSNIENVEYKERDLMSATLLFTIEVINRKHLADVMRAVRRLAVVNAVYRHPV